MPYPATFSVPQTRADWAAQNPYVPQFEFAQESDAPYGIKAGPGYWNDLSYLGQSGVKVYRARLNQTGTADPTATVFENTFGADVVWVRDDIGTYLASVTGTFPETKTTVLHNSPWQGGGSTSYQAAAGGGIVTLATGQFDGVSAWAAVDGVLADQFFIEIRVHP